MFEQLTLKKYTEILASNAPTPGGGSALAVVASIACSLVEMSINVTNTKTPAEQWQSHAAFLPKRGRNFCAFRMRTHRLSDIFRLHAHAEGHPRPTACKAKRIAKSLSQGGAGAP